MYLLNKINYLDFIGLFCHWVAPYTSTQNTTTTIYVLFILYIYIYKVIKVSFQYPVNRFGLNVSFKECFVVKNTFI